MKEEQGSIPESIDKIVELLEAQNELAREKTMRTLRRFKRMGWEVEGSLSRGYWLSLPAKGFKVFSEDVYDSPHPSRIEKWAGELYSHLINDATYYKGRGKKTIFNNHSHQCLKTHSP